MRTKQVTDATTNQHIGQRFFDQSRCFNEVETITRVLFDAGRHREYVWIENDIRRIETNDFGEYFETALTNFDFSLDRIRLTVFVKRHNDHCRTVVTNQLRLLNE